MESYYFVMFFMTKRRVFRVAGKQCAPRRSVRQARALCRTLFAAGSFRAAAFGYSPSFAPSGRAGMSVASSLNSTGRSPSLQEQIATPGVRIQSL